MFKYKKKLKQVEPFYWEYIDQIYELMTFLNDCQVNYDVHITYQYTGYTNALICIHHDEIKIIPTNYIIKDRKKGIRVYSKEDFENDFELISDDEENKE